jgi:LacI family transcriptional regulator
MATPPSTMSDIARRAGVHASTVSRALRDDPRIPPKQRALVRRVAQELNYRANPFVAALMSARRGRRGPNNEAMLAYLTTYAPERAATFARDFGQLLLGARARAQTQGYRIEEFNLHDPALTAHRMSEILHTRGIHGILVAPLYSVHDPVGLNWSEFSTVGIGLSLTKVSVTRVAHNHFTAYGLAARQCRAAGRARLGLVVPRRVHEKVEKRWLAAALLDQSEQPANTRVPPLLLDQNGAEQFAAWFHRHRPEVVLAVNLTEVTAWLKTLGLKIPRDLCLVSLDRRPGDRGIAGIDQNYQSWGGNAVDVLIGMLQRNERGLPEKPLTVLNEGVWIDGRTLPRARA